MAQTAVRFPSGDLSLAGILHVPDEAGADVRRPAFLVLHGFGSGKNAVSARMAAEILERFGYVALRFDMRGCGESEGERAWILCQDQVEDTRNALTWLETHDQVDPRRIGVIGHSFGAAVAVYAGGIDERIAAVVSVGGWGDGVSKFRDQHPGEKWTRFVRMLEQGRRHRRETGTSLMVPRWDIVPIPEHLRRHMAEGAVMEFPAETAQSMMDFRANDVVGNISPRPLLLLHPAEDTVTPTDQSVQLFRNARQPVDMHLVSGVDHFMFADDDGIVQTILKDWLDKHLPVQGPQDRTAAD